MLAMTDHSRLPQFPAISPALEQGVRLIGASPAPMFIVRADGGMIAANVAYTALLNGAPAAIAGAWMPPAALPPGASGLAARILDGSLAQASTEVELATRVQLALSPVCEPDGAIVGVLGVAAAAPQQGDQAARELGRLIELSPVGVVRYTLDGDILDCNDAFLSMLGLGRNDLRAGLSWRALTPPQWREVDDAGLARLREDGVMPLIEKEFLHRDGRCIPVLVGAGNLLADRRQGFAVVVDISATRAAERALAESEARFRAITNAMPQMVWSTLPDGFHDYYNDQWYAFTGVPYGSTDGEGWNGMFHPDDQEVAWARWSHSLVTGEPYEIEYRLRHRDGGYRWVLGRALPVRDAHGGIQRWMGTCTDIHEHKLTEDALREADQRKDEFLAMLGHELRNPLAPIRSAAALLPLAKADPARVEHIGRVIARQSTHMTGLIDDLLDVSRVTRGLIALVQEDVAARLLVDEAVEQARPLVEARAHALAIVDHADGACVHGDRKRLVQVIANLLANAAKYTPPGGSIVVTLVQVDKMVEIAVGDNGIGMAPDLVDSVFELFRQGQRTPDRAQGGLGIGLALVKKLVHLHGGWVRASSAGEGLGSEVMVALPACEPA
ncbi:hybrid sensor histidine kinase/response regulator [Massilia oculi]|uniref:histidine kinase n=2 Tax=Massilia oculi TaxID=945844 RepID=A0A2S2DPJ2_9BURK|nr:hybrid sensor histidine kinase/response regulator [Massilia oculi]